MGRKYYTTELGENEHLVESKEQPGTVLGQARDAENKNPRFVKLTELDSDDLFPKKSEAELEHEKRIWQIEEDQAKINLDNSCRKSEHESRMEKNRELNSYIETGFAIFSFYKGAKKFLKENPEIANALRLFIDKAVEKVSGGFKAAKDFFLILIGKKKSTYETILEGIRQRSEETTMQENGGNNGNDVYDVHESNDSAEILETMKNRLADISFVEDQQNALILLVRYASMKAAGVNNPGNILEGVDMTSEQRQKFINWMDQMIESRPEVLDEYTLGGMLDLLENSYCLQKTA